jgi:hypothetical protein
MLDGIFFGAKIGNWGKLVFGKKSIISICNCLALLHAEYDTASKAIFGNGDLVFNQKEPPRKHEEALFYGSS